MARPPEIISFGCRLNAWEAEVMRGHATAAGVSDAIIVNTCAVTAEAQRQARQAIRRARRERPEARIIVTGCAAQIDPAGFAAMAEVDLVLGNEEKLRPASWAASDFDLAGEEKVRVNDIMSVTETAGHLIDGFGERARAFVQVQTGCDHRCTFCIIPFGRGNSRSVPAGAVVDQARRLVAAGWREIVLCGVDITAWGADLPGRPALGSLVRSLLRAVPELARLRLSSIDSIEADGELMAAIAEEERLMPHFHLSLQSGDDLILKRMKRRHTRADAVAFCAEVRRLRPDAVFGADLIAGFPTETEAMFAGSLGLVDDCGLTFLHVFPYSARPGTPAARMPQVAGPAIRDRARRLRDKADGALTGWLAGQVGATRTVLFETASTGRTEHYAPVTVAEGAAPGTLVPVALTGTRVPVALTGAGSGGLIGTLAA